MFSNWQGALSRGSAGRSRVWRCALWRRISWRPALLICTRPGSNASSWRERCSRERQSCVFEDIEGCIAMSQNFCCKTRSKHIGLNVWLLREHVGRGVVWRVSCPTGDICHGGMTKGLTPCRFAQHRDVMLGRAPRLRHRRSEASSGSWRLVLRAMVCFLYVFSSCANWRWHGGLGSEGRRGREWATPNRVLHIHHRA